MMENIKIERLDKMGWVVIADTKKFGKQQILFQDSTKEDCEKWVKAEMDLYKKALKKKEIEKAKTEYNKTDLNKIVKNVEKQLKKNVKYDELKIDGFKYVGDSIYEPILESNFTGKILKKYYEDYIEEEYFEKVELVKNSITIEVLPDDFNSNKMYIDVNVTLKSTHCYSCYDDEITATIISKEVNL